MRRESKGMDKDFMAMHRDILHKVSIKCILSRLVMSYIKDTIQDILHKDSINLLINRILPIEPLNNDHKITNFS